MTVCSGTLLAAIAAALVASEQPQTINLWPATPPDETRKLPPERDTTGPDGRLVAGRRVMRIGNVTTPQIMVYPAKPEHSTGAAVVICPGGGHHILAWDLEGTEVAEWLNSIGVTAIVLKYRVPFRHPDRRYLSAVQDAQRAMSIVRSRAREWQVDPQRIGILGFSAGGETAALTAIFQKRLYENVDNTDQTPFRPDFGLLIYSGGLVPRTGSKLHEHVRVTAETTPMFLVHAFDDGVTVHNSLALTAALKDAKVPTELHVFASGGHGYGLRETDAPVTKWPKLAEAWLHQSGFLSDSDK